MNYTVDAVDKAMTLLFLVAEQSGSSLSQLATRSGITKARAYRLLNTLEQNGLIRRDSESASFGLSYRTLYLGALAQDQLSIVRIAKKYLGEIGNTCNEDVVVRVRDGLETVCIARWDSSHTVRVHTEIGSRKPIYAGASGKLLLAYAPSELKHSVFASDMEQFTPNTIVRQDQLSSELQTIQSCGYSVSFSELANGAISVAAPVRDVQGDVVAALSIASPAHRVQKDRLQTFIELVLKGAREFSNDLGYTETLSS